MLTNIHHNCTTTTFVIANGMLKHGTEFPVLPTDDHWFGVTYKEDKPTVEAAFRKLIEDGEYKADLYSDL